MTKQKEPLNDILKDGGLFCGGFVRDYLIRGEEYDDIDFYFPEVTPEPYASWDIVGGAKTMIMNKKKFHCCKNTPYDITCNIFSFNGEKINARPTLLEVSYTRSWELIFERKFIYSDFRDIRVREKMRRRGWEMVGIDFRKRSEPFAPSHGPWSDFTLAAERFTALTRP
jgi:hypothetical protein